ncbi:MAG: hypothetical protein SOI26_07830 [Coriobacteriales bacterium]
MDLVYEMTRAFSFDAPGFPALAVASVIAFYLGYIEYVWSIRIVRREHRSPFPLWVHCFYFAHDTTAGVIWFCNAQATDWFWLWTIGSPAFFLWACIEIVNMYYAYKYERQEILGPLVHREVTLRDFMLYVICYVAMFYTVVNTVRIGLHDNTMWTWSVLTQTVMACAHTNLWRRRGERRGTSVKLAIYMVCSMALTYVPFGMYALSFPETHVFNHPWYYLCGIVCTAIAIANLVYVAKLPPKERIEGEKRPIW